MHYWGVILDSVAVINLVVSLGLSVDYSAHIGLAYSISSPPAHLTDSVHIRNYKTVRVFSILFDEFLFYLAITIPLMKCRFLKKNRGMH